MTIRLFYKTQRELSEAVNQIIDEYWEDKINEQTLMYQLCEIYKNNYEKVMKDNQFTSIVQQHCGKRRLILFKRILQMEELISVIN
jgi:uncharacterized protein (TIGR04540 family)